MNQYSSTKTFGHDTGLSCVFRQWRATSHCRFFHGYAIAVKLEFVADELDPNGWVMDFGGLKAVKEQLVDLFDHKTLVAADDPWLDAFEEMARHGFIQLRVVRGTGCEHFARLIFELVEAMLPPRVHLRSVEVAEHGANSAIYRSPAQDR